jgi:hypothetical protein
MLPLLTDWETHLDAVCILEQNGPRMVASSLICLSSRAIGKHMGLLASSDFFPGQPPVNI